QSLQTLLSELQQQQFEVADHQAASIEDIQRWANVPWHRRLFESLVVFQNYQSAEAERLGDSVTLELLAAPEVTNYALTITVTWREDLLVKLIYQPDQIGGDDVRQIGTDLLTLLEAMLRQPTASVADIRSQLPESLRGKARDVSTLPVSVH